MRFLLSSLMAAAAVVTAPAYAVPTITFGGVAATGDSSGQTSAHIGSANVNVPGSGFFLESFDNRNGLAGASQCGLDTPSSGPGALITVTGGPTDTYALQSGSTPNVAAAPAGDTTCFAYGPTENGTLPDTITVDYTGLLGAAGVPYGVGPGYSLNYLGLYYGSIDDYNDLIFYTASGDVTTLRGEDILALFNGLSGDQQADSSNKYVNIDFGPGEQFVKFQFVTRGIAFEMDNVVVGVAPNAVPEPASLALLGLGLAALGWTGRRRSQAKKQGQA